jgi:formylglycine-generating enzyme required for sulfatase activity
MGMNFMAKDALMKSKRFVVLMLICVLLALGSSACGLVKQDKESGDDKTPKATTVPKVSANADWTPVIQTFNGREMVLVPPGCFTLGNDEGRRDERPAQEYCFTKAYWIDRTEITNAQYGSNGAFEGDTIPRGNLTWAEARDFCASQGGRLPSEVEWEYAVRGPDNLTFPWGNEYHAEYIVVDGAETSTLEPVASHPENASWVGAYDLIGNATEWVSSVYAQYPYDASDGREDLNATDVLRVYRGGRSDYQEWGTHASTRYRLDPNERNWFLSFRCVRDE